MVTIPKHIKAVIFDFDGLLIDSERLWSKADYQLLGKRGHTPTEELFHKRLGTGNKRTVEIYKEEFNILEDTEKLEKERLDVYFGILEKELSLMPGAENLITSLAKNKKLAIATSGSYKARIDTILHKLHIGQYFEAVVTGEDIERHKPFPDLFLKAAEFLSIASNDCLVLEDAPNGVAAAKAADMMVFGVNQDAVIEEKLRQEGADKVVSSLEDIRV